MIIAPITNIAADMADSPYPDRPIGTLPDRDAEYIAGHRLLTYRRIAGILALRAGEMARTPRARARFP